MSGQAVHRLSILDVSNAKPCVVTTETVHGFSTGSFVRITDLNGAIKTPPGPRGMNPINDKRFRIVVIDEDEFSLEDPITFESIDSTNYTPYIQGGSVNLITEQFIYEPEE